MAAVTGTFANVTLGIGEVEFDNRNVGFLKGVKLTVPRDILKFKAGVPRMIYGQTTREQNFRIEADVFEISAENVAMMLGGLTIVPNAGAPVTKTAQILTFAAHAGDVLESIICDGPNVDEEGTITLTTLADVPLVVNDDYILVNSETNRAKFYANPGGDITTLQSVKATYTYTPSANKQLNLGASFALEQKSVLFTHLRPNNGKFIKAFMHLASVDGAPEFDFTGDDHIATKVTFEAIADGSNPDNPLGYLQIEQ